MMTMMMDDDHNDDSDDDDSYQCGDGYDGDRGENDIKRTIELLRHGSSSLMTSSICTGPMFSPPEVMIISLILPERIT